MEWKGPVEGSGTSASVQIRKAVDWVFEYWPGFGDGVMGMDRYFRRWNRIGKESVAGKANVLQDVEAVRLVPTRCAGTEGAGEL